MRSFRAQRQRRTRYFLLQSVGVRRGRCRRETLRQSTRTGRRVGIRAVPSRRWVRPRGRGSSIVLLGHLPRSAGNRLSVPHPPLSAAPAAQWRPRPQIRYKPEPEFITSSRARITGILPRYARKNTPAARAKGASRRSLPDSPSRGIQRIPRVEVPDGSSNAHKPLPRLAGSRLGRRLSGGHPRDAWHEPRQDTGTCGTRTHASSPRSQRSPFRWDGITYRPTRSGVRAVQPPVSPRPSHYPPILGAVL